MPSGVTTDLIGAGRFQLTGVDLGAYEADATRTNAYLIWVNSTGLTTGVNAAYGQSPASDKIPNLLKFAFDLDPLAVFDIQTGEIREGKLPRRAERLVQDWFKTGLNSIKMDSKKTG